jgi:membrane protein implicated in regulation of membrane protease activity
VGGSTKDAFVRAPLGSPKLSTAAAAAGAVLALVLIEPRVARRHERDDEVGTATPAVPHSERAPEPV